MSFRVHMHLIILDSSMLKRLKTILFVLYNNYHYRRNTAIVMKYLIGFLKYGVNVLFYSRHLERNFILKKMKTNEQDYEILTY